MVILLLALLALLYGVATAFVPAIPPELEPEARSLGCSELRVRVDAWRATAAQPAFRVRVRSSNLAVIGDADGERGTFLCEEEVWPASHLPMAGAPGQRIAYTGDSTVTIQPQRDALWVLDVCSNCGPSGFGNRHARTPAQVEAARPLGYALTAGSIATLLGLLVWFIVRRRRSADGFVD